MKQYDIDTLNNLGDKKIPFISIIDFSSNNIITHRLDNLPKDISFSFPNLSKNSNLNNHKITKFTKSPINYSNYKTSFDKVIKHLKRGDTYLLNLTMKTQIETNLSLKEIYEGCSARYKLLYKDTFTFFSPEKFIKIEGNSISTYPMKGTIDAGIPNAKQVILENIKESAEHATIVDLLRNDLSQIATNVTVEKYRYIESLETNEKSLLQVTSKITGELNFDWQSSIGIILSKLLPAGSISGAPKPETLSIINDIEESQRGFYTGVTVLFDGEKLDSCVNIRFIEKSNDTLYYRSGGGITHQSSVKDEYQEMVDKIYVPIS